MKLSFIFIFLFGISLIVNSQQIPNGDFESWSFNGDYYEPDLWNTPNSVSYVFPFNVLTTTQDTSSFMGSYASRLETKEILGMAVPGLLTLGELTVDVFGNSSTISGGVPFNYRPFSIEGYYKYSPQPNDSALIGVFMLKHNSSSGITDTIGIGAFYESGSINIYTKFEAEIEYYTSETPDSMNIIVMPSDKDNPIIGSILYIDNLSFNYTTNSINIESEHNISVHPNPSSGIFNIIKPKDLSEIRVSNLIGEVVYTCSTKESEASLSLSGCQRGIYILELFNNKERIIEKILIK